MGALTLTNLLPVAFEALDVISREQMGMVLAVSRDSKASQAALNDYVTSHVVGEMPAEDLVAANVSATTPSQTIGNVQVQITKSRSVPFGITGEETMSLRNAGTLSTINRDRLAQAFRTLGKEMDKDLTSLHSATSRAYGTATGTPFGTAANLSDFAEAGKILTDNGAPGSNRKMVLDSTKITTLKGLQSGLFKVNEAGTDDLLRRGILGNVQGFDISETANAVTSVAGTAASATTDAAGYAVGAKVITLAAIGTGTIVAGDILTFAGDTNKYVVVSGDTNVADAGTITLAEPGLRVAMTAATKAITVIAATQRSMFFQQSAIVLATRRPAMPEGGDMADDVVEVTDPFSGITYELVVYRQKRQVRYEVNLAWGYKMIAPRHTGLLIGA